MPETKKYPRLYLELLENKQKVREDMMFNEITYSILPSKTSENFQVLFKKVCRQKHLLLKI